MTASAAFYISLALLLVFIALKAFEHSHSFTRYEAFRRVLDAYVVKSAVRVHTQWCRIAHAVSVDTLTRVLVHHAARATATAARGIEREAHELSKRVARGTNGGARKERSSYLSEVETHKNSLDTDRVKRETKL